MMNINWKFLTPVSLVLFMLVILFGKLFENYGQNIQYLSILIINLGLFFISLKLINNKEENLEIPEVGLRSRPVAKPDNLFSKDISRG